MAAAQAAENHGDSEALTETFDEGYIHQLESEPIYKIH